MRLLTPLLLLVGLLPASAQASFTVGSYAFHASDSVTSESLGSGNVMASDGYFGTFSFDCANSGPAHTFYVYYVVSIFDADTSEWQVYNSNWHSLTAGANTNGTFYVNFLADVLYGVPNGAYQVSAWVVDGTLSGSSLNVSSVHGGADGSDALTVAASAADDPLPDPEPSPGPDPGLNTPVVPPPLPPSGPIGPGTSRFPQNVGDLGC